MIAQKTEAQPAPTRMVLEIVHITLQTKGHCHLKSSFMSGRDVPDFNTAMPLESLFQTGLGPG